MRHFRLQVHGSGCHYVLEMALLVLSAGTPLLSKSLKRQKCSESAYQGEGFSVALLLIYYMQVTFNVAEHSKV